MTQLPMRDFNQELEKANTTFHFQSVHVLAPDGRTIADNARVAAHALELAVKALIENEVVTDKDDPSVQGVRALAEVLADRLDDLVHMNDDEQLPLHESALDRAAHRTQ